MRSILSLTLIISLSLTSVLGFSKGKKPTTKSLSLEEIFASGKFSQRSVYGVNSLKDGQNYASLIYGAAPSIVIYNYSSGEAVDTLVKQAWLTPEGASAPIRFAGYSLSADESLVMLSTAPEQIYRYSSLENNYIFERSSKKLYPLSPNGKQAYAAFSPNGKKVGFMRDNNLFMVDLASMAEIQITFDGKTNEIINGGTDWVYEEEFGFTRAFFWSPNSQSIFYYKIDEREVREFVMPMYEGLYPTNFTFKYPKAGEKNALVTMHLYEVATGKHMLAEIGPEKDQYIARAGWTKDSNSAWIQRVNRHQNKVELLFIDAKTGQSKVVLTETSEQWVDINDDLTFLDDGLSFIWSSERSGYNQLYLYGMDGQMRKQLTQGDYDVASFYGFDEKNQRLYYSKAYPSAMERTVYSAALSGEEPLKLSPNRGKNSASFSADFSHYLHFHTDANSPLIVSMHKGSSEQIRVVQNNADLRKTLSEYNLAKKEFFDFDNGQGDILNGFMLKPVDFNSKKKYPVLMFVYGGPGSQTVDASFGQHYMWFQYLTQQGYIVVSIDNRGTGFRGSKFKKCIYQQLGKYEIADQMAGASYLGDLPYVDKARIGMFGWSYGGYMSSLAITVGADLFKTAVAVAPVINWRFYDTIYTERYMRTPQENASGYDDNSPSSHAEKLKGNYLLIHGTADDNVHFQNALVMSEKLVKANKQFDFMAYTDKNHGISGGTTRLQLFTKITNYLQANL